MRKIGVVIAIVLAAGRATAQAPDPPPLSVAAPQLTAALIVALADTDFEVRVNAANALAALGPPAVESLITSLGSANRDVRSAAAYALGQMGADAAPAAAGLLRVLKDTDTDVRRQSAQALGRILLAQRFPGGTQPAVQPVQPPPPAFPILRPPT